MSAADSSRHPLEELTEDFIRRLRNGECPSISEYERRHSELAGEIRDLFPALLLLERGRPHLEASPPERGLEAGVKLGEYMIVREAGRGGMGIVYEAVQLRLGRRVALKVLAGHMLDSLRLQRFEFEARTAARLHHTNIVPVFGMGEHEGIYYYVMQFIDGLGLDQYLDRLRHSRGEDVDFAEGGGPAICFAEDLFGAGALVMSPGDPAHFRALLMPRECTYGPRAGATYYRWVARVGLQAAEALAFAHAHGVLHRDVKPSNLLLDTQGGVWMSDFGLAKAESLEDQPDTDELAGTLRYMAPERLSGKTDARSDVFSLGLTIYEMLTLRPAFAETDRALLLRQVAQSDPPPPRVLDRYVPRDIEAVVIKAIVREPENRYASAQALADDLRAFLADRPVVAQRTSGGKSSLGPVPRQVTSDVAGRAENSRSADRPRAVRLAKADGRVAAAVRPGAAWQDRSLGEGSRGCGPLLQLGTISEHPGAPIQDGTPESLPTGR